EVWPVVIRIFFEPGVEAGLFGALPAVRRARFQFGDLLREVGVEILPGPDSRTYQRVIPVCAGHPFRKPQCARVLLLCIVDGFERSGANAFHIPEMEKLMRRNSRKSLAGGNIDCGSVSMLHPAAGSLRRFADMQNEQVTIEWRAAHELHFVAADFA